MACLVPEQACACLPHADGRARGHQWETYCPPAKRLRGDARRPGPDDRRPAGRSGPGPRAGTGYPAGFRGDRGSISRRGRPQPRRSSCPPAISVTGCSPRCPASPRPSLRDSAWTAVTRDTRGQGSTARPDAAPCWSGCQSKWAKRPPFSPLISGPKPRLTGRDHQLCPEATRPDRAASSARHQLVKAAGGRAADQCRPPPTSENTVRGPESKLTRSPAPVNSFAGLVPGRSHLVILPSGPGAPAPPRRAAGPTRLRPVVAGPASTGHAE